MFNAFYYIYIEYCAICIKLSDKMNYKDAEVVRVETDACGVLSLDGV